MSRFTPSSSFAKTKQLCRELLLCIALSFIILLGIIHGLLHVLHRHYSAASPSPSPPSHSSENSTSAEALALALRIASIAMLHAYLTVVFKVTVACSVLVFAARELGVFVGVKIGWLAEDEEEDAEDGRDSEQEDIWDMEAAEVCLKREGVWYRDEKTKTKRKIWTCYPLEKPLFHHAVAAVAV
ncbi:hypothetical protein C8F01DRAFT_1185968 [Mycena amicta]|nr:hypothetical protein C8F01DRAFT_1185968 [Mycena amicta]